jgi:hypothetical protein
MGNQKEEQLDPVEKLRCSQTLFSVLAVIEIACQPRWQKTIGPFQRNEFTE